ncbi:hypothetical protein MKEN_01288500 [Mycena kentingensis (nom. inval.)]|nr:hypothetical protein MKEN_01288500 [Mycena kentingensis (nom. inval.)]
MRVERQRHSHVSALSSPPRSTSTGLDRFLKRPPKPQPFSNNLQPKPHPFQHSQVSSAFLPSRVVPAPVAAAPVIVTAPSLSHNTLPPSPRTKPTAHSNPVAKLPSLFAHKPRTVQSYAVVAPSLPASPPAKVFHPPPEPHKPSRAVKQQPLSDADDFPMSPPYAPDSPSPAPRQKRITIPSKPKAAPRPNKPQRNEDAYDFGGAPDADEAWSTFGGSRTKKPMIQTTKTFRLPMLAPSKGKRAQSGRTGMSANASTRVITFLPPPLNSVSGKVEVVVEDVLHRHALPQKHRANSPAMDMSATPPKRRKLDASPETNTSFTLPSSSPLPKFSPAAERSPPTPTVPKSPKGHEFINIPLISRRYRHIKARMQDRHPEMLWNMLDLPSCGLVHEDGEERREELPLMVWPSSVQDTL